MNVRNTLGAILVISGALSAQLAYALTITFDCVPSSRNPIVTSVTTVGFTFASGHFHTIDSITNDSNGLVADSGSPVYIAEEDGRVGVDITMAESGGATFSLNAFDGAEFFISAPDGLPNATAISVVGTLFGGGTVSALFALDGVVDGAGGATDFQTFVLPKTFVNLTSVTFSGLIGATGTGGLSLDNIVVNEELPPQLPPLLDHFLSYRTKATRGNFCAAGAPMNVGGACDEEGDCGGIEDDTALCVPDKFPKGVQVILSDQFDTDVTFDVKRPVSLHNPADKNCEGINDRVTHLQGFRIIEAKGQPKHIPQENVTIENQFHPSLGVLKVDTRKPDRLLVPSAKNALMPVNPPDPTTHNVDHFKCYSVKVSKDAPEFPKDIQVMVEDQFTSPATLYEVKKPTRLCVPAGKTLLPGGGPELIKNPADHLMCYQVKPAKGQPEHVKVKGIFVNNQLRPDQVDTLKEGGELCVPSLKSEP